MQNMSGSGDFMDGSDGEIFQENDVVDAKAISQDRFYYQQINDTYGKEEINEKMIADATGAREVLKKQKKRGIFDEDMGHNEMNIFEILQMFRDHRGNAVAGEREQSMRIGVDQIQQLLMEAAHADEFSDGDGIDDVHEAQQFGIDFGGIGSHLEEAK